ncbi:MAG: phage tail protein [Muribaculaceae bacterium]|nr:phage tail protein [Muribaculaceae bacterium]
MEGYVNGSDFLLDVAGAAPGHCTSHKITYNSDTKNYATKPPASAEPQDGKWQDSVVSGLSYQGSAEGYIYDGETEQTIAVLRKCWVNAQPVAVKAFRRGKQTAPYLVGKVIITSVDENHPANDQSTYTVNFQSSGKPDVFEPDTTLPSGTGGTQTGNS